MNPLAMMWSLMGMMPATAPRAEGAVDEALLPPRTVAGLVPAVGDDAPVIVGTRGILGTSHVPGRHDGRPADPEKKKRRKARQKAQRKQR